MSDLQSLIKRLSTGPASTQSYVYYNKETGKIYKVSSNNVPEKDLEIFEIPTKEVETILTGERRTEEFIITYDVSLKQIRLKEVAYDDTHNTASTMCYELPTITALDKQQFEESFLTPQYTDIHIDVWYNELLHLAGQHVWKDDTVYKLLKDQDADTEFNIDNADVIVNNVKLYADENKNLNINHTITNGDLILKNNKIFVFDYKRFNVESNHDIIICQDTVAGSWNIKINEYTKKFLIMSGYNPKETLYFSITSKYDPNILYRSLEFNIGNIINESQSVIPFIYDSEYDPNNVSIYTAKYFENYAHEII